MPERDEEELGGRERKRRSVSLQKSGVCSGRDAFAKKMRAWVGLHLPNPLWAPRPDSQSRFFSLFSSVPVPPAVETSSLPPGSSILDSARIPESRRTLPLDLASTSSPHGQFVPPAYSLMERVLTVRLWQCTTAALYLSLFFRHPSTSTRRRPPSPSPPRPFSPLPRPPQA